MNSQRVISTARFVVASVLCAQLALPLSVVSQEPTQAPGGGQDQQMKGADAGVDGLPTQMADVKVKAVPKKLVGDDPYLLVLDRFTYGARPGDLERIKSMGLSGWFNQQLNPQKIDDSALDAKLMDYPAMQMPLTQLMELYPTNGAIKASMNGRMGIPGGDAAHAIYTDNQARYKAKKANKANKGNDMEADADVVPLPMTPAEIVAMPPDKRFKMICHLSLSQIKEVRKELPADQREKLTDGFTPPQLEAMAAFNSPRGVVEAEDVQVKLLRDIYSERQLQEVMVDFWLNHFNVYIKKSQQAPYYIAAYERNSIRPFALGHFQDLLIATAVSPAMLNYLDASESVGPHSEFVTGFNRRGPGKGKRPSGLNENYAREVMELHTVGVNAGYTQKDVTELAKAFTGWTVGKKRGQDVLTTAQFDPEKHEPGTKVVMGMKITDDGQGEGMKALKMLASSPQCAKFISTKLAIRFVGDNPSPAMIERMSGTFLETHGDIRKVLLAMVNSPEFFTTATYRAKVKTPQDYVVSAVRAAGSDVQSTSGLATAIADLGMPLYGMQTPNGYSMKTEAWNSTAALVSRMNFAMALGSNRVHGVSTNLDSLLGGKSATMTAEQKTLALESQLLKVPVSDKTQKLILEQTTGDTGQQAAEIRQVSAVQGKRNPLEVRGSQRRVDDGGLDTQAALAAGLIFGSPEFQRR